MTEGAPAKAYLSRQHSKTREVRRSVEVKTPVAGEKVFTRVINRVTKFFKKEITKLRVSSEEIRLDPASTKGFYRMLKRNRRRVIPDLAIMLSEKGI